ncbi:ImmA/IrrE family metallo-endopeptidase [Pseudarthrobacter sp. PS3-L1]|uniref:ImmA/IrrE family metallo-endopeptidase n=1 Tax=Pseudarthrobacter sp. PS3-L1 TaxID=3046207 RepID=UPI0024BB5DAB|nr:ImmA/IrrE family metallo-endopeptidase [Pseudarthrobacter sp. PS3-L1]MDJ0319794.1 ImmA/IrrE family metallo-endopeptidase [Pseudarthrobacter sp. PS3-L1]
MGFEKKAEEMGVKILYKAPPHGWWGCWDPDKRHITLHPDLGYIQLRSTAWHELGHAHYEHIGHTPKQELQASVWAARHLIRPHAFVEAARITDDLISIAHRLHVLPEDVRAWEKSLTLEELIHIRKEINGPC